MPADPGGVFKSDEHRRVLALCGEPYTLAQLGAAVERDAYTDFAPLTSVDGAMGFRQIAEDLVADGLLSESGGLYSISEQGMAKLNGSNGNETNRMTADDAVARIDEYIAEETARVDAELDILRKALDAGEIAANAVKESEETVSGYKSDLSKLRATVVADHEQFDAEGVPTLADGVGGVAPAPEPVLADEAPTQEGRDA